MSEQMIILLVGLLYIVLLGGLALLRREGLSARFAVEAAIITGVVSGLMALTGFSLSPIAFVILLYLLTMRVRLLVDMGTLLARQGKTALAGKIYAFTGHLWPDSSSELILQVNQATLLLEENKLDEAITMFSGVLQKAEEGFLGVKYEAVAHYNLGVAYQRQNLPGRAIDEFNAVIDTWPASLYAHRAQDALNRQRIKEKSTIKKPTV